MPPVSFNALAGIPEIEAGADLASCIADALQASGCVLHDRDVLVVAQKIVSKAEGRTVDLATVVPSSEARRLAEATRKDPRVVEVILGESEEIVRAVPNVLIVRHRLGFVMANAGVDRSNVPPARAGDAVRERVLLLPRDPDGSAAVLRESLTRRLGVSVGVIVSDSFGRPWRRGVLNVALGSAGIPSLIDRRGERDREGRALEVTEVAFADAIAAGAALAMGEAAEGTPVVLVRGLDWQAAASGAGVLRRPKSEDLFR
ncbi:MAG TPA: coenzyme F420-0:L-glutamate ligase [Steroidobacteraceae bacterium]|jgi:coenzyme F420-0:L-glutamate ligase/coenzyme F420-1:gamma-L-glutamate ligase